MPHETPKVAEQVKRRDDRGWAVRRGSTPARAFQRPHRAHRRTNSPTECESSTTTSNATGTGVQTVVAATIETSSMRGAAWIGYGRPAGSPQQDLVASSGRAAGDRVGERRLLAVAVSARSGEGV